ncbi:hypothetical protein B0O99DRAFT_604744 [Bisporella sp. PMI_857]|nr:hypothetical protein B0O99DRAFT_604744 [Bisporella sp. PMI_857]
MEKTSSSSDNLAATSFTSFPLLPYEIRLRIWEFIAPGPRTVQVSYHANYKQFNGRASAAFDGWISKTPIPTILHICHESRVEALKSFQLAFGTYFHKPTIYLNFDMDTVLFGDEDLADNRWSPSSTASDYLLDVLLGGGYHGPDDTDKIQNMVFDIHEDLYARRNFCWDEIRLFAGLKEITLRVWDEDNWRERLMSHYRATLTVVAKAHPEWVIPKIRVASGYTKYEWGTITLADP